MKKTAPALIATLLITAFLVVTMLMIGREALAAAPQAAAFIPVFGAFL